MVLFENESHLKQMQALFGETFNSLKFIPTQKWSEIQDKFSQLNGNELKCLTLEINNLTSEEIGEVLGKNELNIKKIRKDTVRKLKTLDGIAELMPEHAHIYDIKPILLKAGYFQIVEPNQ